MGGRTGRTARPGAPVSRVMRRLGPAIDRMEDPAIERIAKIADRQKSDAFQVLVATMLSAQTKDAVTFAASTRLFARAVTPAALARLSVGTIERLIYPVSFYRNKARHVRAACRQLLEQFEGRVPTTMDALLTLPGVGRENGEPGPHRGPPQQYTHLRRHARAPYLPTVWAGSVRRRRSRPNRRSTRWRLGAGGRTSTCIWCPGGRTSAGRSTLVATRVR